MNGVQVAMESASQRALYIEAIDKWTQSRRADDTRKESALKPEEFRALSPGDRLITSSRAELEGMAHYLRNNPRESAVLGVFHAICILCDIGEGVCEMAQERLARFFGRSRGHINECIDALAEAGLIIIDGKLGRPKKIRPVIGRVFATKGQHLWLFDALAPRTEPAKPGRKPRAAARIEIAVTDAMTPNSEIGVTAAMTGNEIAVATALTAAEKYLSSQRLHDSPVVADVVNTPGEERQEGEGARQEENIQYRANGLNGLPSGEPLPYQASGLVPPPSSAAPLPAHAFLDADDFRDFHDGLLSWTGDQALTVGQAAERLVKLFDKAWVDLGDTAEDRLALFELQTAKLALRSRIATRAHPPMAACFGKL